MSPALGTIILSSSRCYDHRFAGFQLQPVEEPQGEAFEQAVEVVLPYLLSYRGRLASQRQVYYFAFKTSQ